jgi:hypothetical protein
MFKQSDGPIKSMETFVDTMLKRNWIIYIRGKENYLQNYLDLVTFKTYLRGLKMDEKSGSILLLFKGGVPLKSLLLRH